jgi:hypothetical protein
MAFAVSLSTVLAGAVRGWPFILGVGDVLGDNPAMRGP